MKCCCSSESRRPLLFGQLIIMVVYLLIFAPDGVEGKMFHPMAFTVVVAFAGAMVLSMTFVPAAVGPFLTGLVARKKPADGLGQAGVREGADKALSRQPLVLTITAVSVALAALMATRMGSEFIPSLDEHDIALHALTHPRHQLEPGHRDANAA